MDVLQETHESSAGAHNVGETLAGVASLQPVIAVSAKYQSSQFNSSFNAGCERGYATRFERKNRQQFGITLFNYNCL